MTETNFERLGMRGLLALFGSTLRLVGAANATGAITAGAALHAFAQEAASVQGRVKLAALLFLCGVLSFCFGYALWFMTTLELDFALRKPGEVDEAEQILLRPFPGKSADDIGKSAKRHYIWMVIAGLLAVIFFMTGLLSGASVLAVLPNKP